MKNTNNAVLARELDKKVTPAESVSPSSVYIFDGMSLTQEMHGENCTLLVFGMQ